MSMQTRLLVAAMCALGVAGCSASSDGVVDDGPAVAGTAVETVTEVTETPTVETPTEEVESMSESAHEGYVIEVHDGEFPGALNEAEQVEFRLLDDSTIVFAEGSDWWKGQSALTTSTPTEAQVQMVIDTVNSDPSLEWARGHTRFIRGANYKDEPVIALQFACDAPSLTSGLQALAVLRDEVLAVTGGGDCYGFTAISLDGAVRIVSTGGES